MAQLEEDIDSKERLVLEMESSNKQIEQMRQQMNELKRRIIETESERDRILNDLKAKEDSKKKKDEIAKVTRKCIQNL